MITNAFNMCCCTSEYLESFLQKEKGLHNHQKVNFKHCETNQTENNVDGNLPSLNI